MTTSGRWAIQDPAAPAPKSTSTCAAMPSGLLSTVLRWSTRATRRLSKYGTSYSCSTTARPTVRSNRCPPRLSIPVWALNASVWPCRVKTSNYDTDVFQPLIGAIGRLAGKTYGDDARCDVAMRVIADHVRTIAFSITDGQLPSNAKAGYVIRRILRRAVRYGYTFLGFQQPFIYKLLPTLIETMGDAYPELAMQKDLIEKVIKEEEEAFLRTLSTGIRLLDKVNGRYESRRKRLYQRRRCLCLVRYLRLPPST